MDELNAVGAHEYIRSLEGAEVARLISIATFGLVVYDHFITLDQEVEHFWNGGWTASRILFLLNRYVPPLIIMYSWPYMQVFYNAGRHPIQLMNCKPTIQACFLLNVLALGVIQAILVLRVWYLFSNNKLIRWIIVASFIASLSTSLYFLYVAAANLQMLESLTQFGIWGCRAERPHSFWRIFLPPLVLHTLLYIFTVIRALRNRQLLKQSPVLKRLLRDGGFFYFVVFFSVGFTAIGAFLTDAPDINTPAIYSNFVLAVTSICVSRVMLSIQSLAAKLGWDTAWLLNNVELSRVAWRPGTREGELIVELNSAYEDERVSPDSDLELADFKTSSHSLNVNVHTLRLTTVGTFRNDFYGYGPQWHW